MGICDAKFPGNSGANRDVEPPRWTPQAPVLALGVGPSLDPSPLGSLTALPGGNPWVLCPADRRGRVWAGPGGGALWDSIPSHPGLVEKETNELLLMESVLRYTRAEGSQPAQPFANPLLGTTSLPWVMDRARLCPPPPALDSTPADIAACE